MPVPAYQIENILTLYCRKLEQSWRGSTSPGDAGPLPDPPTAIMARSKKDAIISKVTASIISRITQMGPQQYMDNKKHPYRPDKAEHPEGTRRFSFVCLDEENRRSWKSITLGNREVIPLEQAPRHADPVSDSE